MFLASCIEDVRFAADVPVGMECRSGAFATFLVGAGTPALLRIGALESLERKL